ncbi:MAG TPA: TetR family transcriptional regulator [Solirubrobacterales bacterium]|nr:TetR family transcriptional regulator [Solirubrobacterales bacterium]
MLEAMLRVAAERGYAHTTIAEVSERAGVGEAEFDGMFESREECFLQAYDAAIDVLAAHVQAAFTAEAEKDWPERVKAGLCALVELLATEPEIARMAIVEVSTAGPDAKDRYHVTLERFTPFFEEGRAYAKGGERLPADTGRFAVGAVGSMIFDEIRAGRAAELRRVLPDLVFAFLMPYLGSAQAEREMKRIL